MSHSEHKLRLDVFWRAKAFPRKTLIYLEVSLYLLPFKSSQINVSLAGVSFCFPTTPDCKHSKFFPQGALLNESGVILC